MKFPPDRIRSAADTFPAGTHAADRPTATAADRTRSNRANPFPSNFQCNPSSIDGLTHHQQLPGRRRHLRPRLGPQPADRQQPRLQQLPARCRAASTSARANSRRSTSAGAANAATNAGSRLVPRASTVTDEPASAVLLQPERERAPQRDHAELLHSVTNCSRPRRRARAASAFCTGADYYKFNYNWVCGNLSTGDGGGVAHLGFSYNGDIEHNTILFNQSTNPTIPTNGGGIVDHGRARCRSGVRGQADAGLRPTAGSRRTERRHRSRTWSSMPT